MQHRRATTVALVLTAASLVAGAVALAARPPDRGPPGGGDGDVFEISGSVEPVYPYLGAPFALKIENSRNTPILVTRIDIDIGDASDTCTADNLLVDPVPVPFEVPDDGELDVVTTARLVDDADDTCQSAVFPLTFTGIATKP